METEVMENWKQTGRLPHNYSPTEVRQIAIETACRKLLKSEPTGLYVGGREGFTDIKELIADAREIEKYLNGG